MQTPKRSNKLRVYILLYISIAVCSSETVVDGYIYNLNGSPISNVEVYIKELSVGSTTDLSGHFKIILPLSSGKANSYSLLISHIGYVSKQIDLLDSRNLKIYLDKNIIDSDEIVVTASGYKSYIKDTPVITHVVTSEEIHNSPYNSVRDIIEFIIPNVQRIHDPHGNDRVKIQGLDNKFVVFMVDGNRISGEFAGNIDLSMLSISDIERIEIIRSGMSTLYGSDSMGGLINIITKKNNQAFSFNTSYAYDLPIAESSSLSLGVNFFNLNYKLNLDYNSSPGYDLTDYSPLSKTLEENIYYKINNSFLYKRNKLAINYINQYYIKKIKHYNDILNSQTGSRETAISGQNPHYNDIVNAFSANYKINDFSNIKLKYLEEVYNKSFYFPYYYNEYPNNLDDGKIILSASPARYEYLLLFNTSIKTHSLLLGLQSTKETYQSLDILSEEGILLEPSIFEDEIEQTINEFSLFFTDKFKIFKQEVVFGLRATQYRSNDWNFIPSFSVRHELYNYNLRLNYSKGYRIPSLKELYYKYEGHDPALYGDPNLEPSLSHYYAISLESRILANSSIEIYFNNVANMISTIYKSDGIYYANNDQINLYGFNVNLQKRIFNCIDINSVYSYTDADSYDQKSVEAISNHTFSMRIKYNLSNQLNFLFTTKYNSKKNVFLYDTEENKELDAYSISDLLLNFKCKKISIKAGFKNIFNYLDPGRLNSDSSEFLTTTHPGRRLYFNIMVSI